jgi:hypothetical protein
LPSNQPIFTQRFEAELGDQNSLKLFVALSTMAPTKFLMFKLMESLDYGAASMYLHD